MAKKTNPKLIGAFVLGGMILTTAGLLAFAGGQFFVQKSDAVMYFEGSLGGLTVGAPVNFRGVQIGSVKSIQIQYDTVRQEMHIPVVVEFEPERIEITNGKRSEHNLSSLVARGLRGQLQVQSLVTGQAIIDFDFHPEEPVHLVGGTSKLPELPTIPSAMESMQANLQAVLNKISQMPLEEIGKNVNGAIGDLRGAVADVDSLIERVKASAGPMLDQARSSMAKMDGVVTSAQARLQLQPGEPLQVMNDTLAEYKRLAQDLRGQVGPVGNNLQATLQEVNGLLGRLDAVAAKADRDYANNPALLTQVSDTLRDTRAALGSIRALAEYLQRNPNALLTGRQ